MLILRSVAFNVAFYLNTLLWLVIGLPTFFLPYRSVMWIAKNWGRANIVLLRLVAGLDCEVRGIEKIPPGPLLVAAKHQSAWETFALLPLFDSPVIIFKRELRWLPIFGWLMVKGRMVAIDRRRGAHALTAMMERARAEFGKRRQLIIFPEGTRRPPGAEPRYKSGIGRLYAAAGAPCLPIALNSGLFWPRRSILRRPGKVLVQILDPIPPGLGRKLFLERLQSEIEAATDRLIAEAQGAAARKH